MNANELAVLKALPDTASALGKELTSLLTAAGFPLESLSEVTVSAGVTLCLRDNTRVRVEVSVGPVEDDDDEVHEV